MAQEVDGSEWSLWFFILFCPILQEITIAARTVPSHNLTFSCSYVSFVFPAERMKRVQGESRVCFWLTRPQTSWHRASKKADTRKPHIPLPPVTTSWPTNHPRVPVPSKCKKSQLTRPDEGCMCTREFVFASFFRSRWERAGWEINVYLYIFIINRSLRSIRAKCE